MATSTNGHPHATTMRTSTDNSKSHQPCIAHSDPFGDLRLYIEHLWRIKKQMCGNIYPDQFPRGEKGQATKQEEDAFLLEHFDAESLHVHGGRFLKQALYSIAKYNEDSVLAFAREWALRNRDFYEDRSMLMGMCGSVAQIKNFFDAEEAAMHPEAFLQRTILAIRHGLQQLHEAQTVAKLEVQQQTLLDAAGQPSVQKDDLEQCMEKSTLQSSEDPVVDSTTVMRSEQAPHGNVSSADQARQGAPPPSHPSSLRTEPTAGPPVSGQPAVAAIALQQLQKYEAVKIQRPPAAAAAARVSSHPLAGIRPDGLPSDGLSPNLAVSMTPMMGPHGAVLDYRSPRRLSAVPPYHLDENHPPHSYNSQAYGPATKGWTPAAQSSQRPRQTSFSYRPRPEDVRYGEMPRNAFSYGRPPRGSFGNSNNMDPNSFERLPGNKRGGKGGYKGGRRPSMYSCENRSSSGHFDDGWRGYKEAPFEPPRGRRIFSDQPPLTSFSPPDQIWQTRDATSATYGRQERRFSQDVSQYDPPNFGPVHNDDPDWVCREDFIGARRSDVTSLVMTKVPNSIGEEEIHYYVSQQCRVVGVDRAVPPVPHQYPRSHPGHSCIFLSFPDMEEARRALTIGQLSIRDYKLRVVVPMKFFNPGHPHYLSPSEAAERIRYGLPYELRRVDGSGIVYHQTAPRHIPDWTPNKYEESHARNLSLERGPTDYHAAAGRDVYGMTNPVTGHRGLGISLHQSSIGPSSGINDYPLEFTNRSDTTVSSPYGLPPCGLEKTPKNSNAGNKAHNNKRKNIVYRGDAQPPQQSRASEDINKPKLKTHAKHIPTEQSSQDDSIITDLRSSSSETLCASTPVEQSEVARPAHVIGVVDEAGHATHASATSTAAIEAIDQQTLHPVVDNAPDDQLGQQAAHVSIADLEEHGGSFEETAPTLNATPGHAVPHSQSKDTVKGLPGPIVESSSSEDEPADVPQSTPQRHHAATHEPRDPSPRLIEDVDESFQTAAETPESVKSTTARDSALVTSIVITSTGDSVEPKLLNHESSSDLIPRPQANDILPSPNIEGLDSDAKGHATAATLTIESPTQETALSSLPKSSSLLKTGPSQTESISPFARAALQKKNEKKTRIKGRSKLKTEVKQGNGKGVIVNKPSSELDHATAPTSERSGGRQPSPADNDSASVVVSEATPITEAESGQKRETVSAKHSFFTSPLAALGALGEKISGKAKGDPEPSKTPSPTKTKTKSEKQAQAAMFPPADVEPGHTKYENSKEIHQVQLTPLPSEAIIPENSSVLIPDVSAEKPATDVDHAQNILNLNEESSISEAVEPPRVSIKKKKNNRRSKNAKRLVTNPEQPTEGLTSVSKNNAKQYIVLDDDDDETSSIGTVTARTPDVSRSVSVEPLQSRIPDPNSSHLVEAGGRKSGKKRTASGKPEKISSTPLHILELDVPEDFSRCKIVTDKATATEDVKSAGENKDLGSGQMGEQGGAHLANVTAVQQSKFKMAEMGHQEKVRKMKSKGDTLGLEKEEDTWQLICAHYKEMGEVLEPKSSDEGDKFRAYTYRGALNESDRNEGGGGGGQSYVLTSLSDQILHELQSNGTLRGGTYSVVE